MPSNRTVFVAMLGLCCVGCNPETFRAETRLLPDGSVERSVYQPLKRVPDDIRQRREWSSNHRIRELKWASDLQLPIDDLLRRFDKSADDEEPNYWMAKGKFTDIKAIPNHLVFKAPDGLKDGRLVRQLERKDWGVVTEWTWNETLTDSFTFTDHRKARSDAVEMAVPIIVAACAETWGPEYDLKEFERWLRGEVASCFQELCDIVLEWGLDKHKHPWESRRVLLAKFDEVFQKHGLHLFDAEHKPLKDEEAKRRFEEFFSKILRQHVRDGKGEPLANEHVRDALTGTEQSRLSRALERVAHAKYGGKEGFQEHVNRLGIRLFGLYYWPPVFRDSQSFDYRMDVAGFVLETNATLVAERTLRWKFCSDDAFPLGYLMRAIVAIPDTDAMAKHFPNAKFDTREIIVDYLDLVRADAQLKLALDDLLQKNDPTLWSEWLQANRDSKMNELLKLKPEAKRDDTP